MAIQVGDAILRFVGDTASLDMAFQKVEAGAQQSMGAVQAEANGAAAAIEGTGIAATEAAAQVNTAWGRMAKATVENRVAQGQLWAALKAAGRAGADNVTSVAALARAQERAALASQNLALAQKEIALQAEQAALAEKDVAGSAVLMGNEAAAAGTKAAFSMHEAKASMALMSEEIGVKIPRHLRGFIAELPGVGKAMEVAFSGFAVLMLIQIIVEAGRKVYEFYEALNVLSEAEKKASEESVKGYEKQLKAQNEALEAEYALKIVRAEGAEKDRLKLELATAQAKINGKYVDDLQTEVNRVQNLVDAEKQRAEATADTTVALANQGSAAAGGMALVQRAQEKAVENGQKYVDTVSGTLEEARNALLHAQAKEEEAAKDHGKKTVETALQTGRELLDARRKVADAQADMDLAFARLRFAQGQITINQEIDAEKLAEDTKYQNHVNYLHAMLLLAEKDPTKNKDEIRRINTDIEVLEQEHATKLIDNQAKLVVALANARKNWTDSLESSSLPGLEYADRDVEKLNQLMQSFGITTSEMWAKQADDAENAYYRALTSGKRTYAELLQLEEKFRQAQLGKAINAGDTAGAEKAKSDLDAVRESMEKIGLTADKVHRKTNSWLDDFAKKARGTRGEMKGVQGTFDQVMLGATQTFGGAIQQWVMGQASLADALRQGLAAELANIAGKAAAWALYFAAWGVADLFWNPARAGADFAAAGQFAAVAAIAGAAAYGIAPRKSSGESSDNSGTPIETTGSQDQPQAQPKQAQNIQRFAAGGLVSAPTLAVIGDSMNGGRQDEVAWPLDDPQATGRISRAVRDAGGGGGGNTYVTIEGVISPDNLDKVMRKMSRRVDKNGAKLSSSKSLRVTRKG